MTAFVNDSGEYLDYTGPDVGITKQCANFYDFKIKGEVSATLKISNNSHNRKVLGYFGAQQVDSPAFSKTSFNMVKDGNIISRGFIVIQSSDKESIDCFYVSGNTNWFQNFQFKLSDIDFNDKYIADFDEDGIEAQKSATEGIIFPLIDYWGHGNRISTWFSKITSTNPDEGIVWSDWFPCVYAHTVLEGVGEYGGVSFGGDLVKSPVSTDVTSHDELFRKLILTPEGPDIFYPEWMVNETKFKVEALPGVYSGTGAQTVQWGAIVENTGSIISFDTSTYTWTAPRTATYRMEFNMEFNVTGKLFEMIEIHNGVDNFTIFSMTLTAERKSVVFYRDIQKGTTVQWTIENTSDATNFRLTLANDRSNLKISVADYPNLINIYPQCIVPDIKAIDFIKFLANYFSCVVTYDEYSNTVEFNLLKNFRKEDAEDWSEYFVSAKVDFKNNVAAKNYIKFTEGPEIEIGNIFNTNKQGYLGGSIDTPFDSAEEMVKYEIPFSTSFDTENPTDNKLFMPYVKFFDLDLQETTTYSAAAASGSRLQLTATFQEALTRNDLYFIKSTTGVYTGYVSLQSFGTTTTNPIFDAAYVQNDTGTILRYKVNKVKSTSRLMVCLPNTNVSNFSNSISSIGLMGGSNTTSTIAAAWSDKPKILTPIDYYDDSVAIDSEKSYSLTVKERYYGPMQKIFNNPKIVAEFRLPLSVFNKFDFKKYVYIKTADLTGYFLVQKIENYRDALTPVKVELLYAD